jgi:hypothetical protein
MIKIHARVDQDSCHRPGTGKPLKLKSGSSSVLEKPRPLHYLTATDAHEAGSTRVVVGKKLNRDGAVAQKADGSAASSGTTT